MVEERLRTWVIQLGGDRGGSAMRFEDERERAVPVGCCYPRLHLGAVRGMERHRPPRSPRGNVVWRHNHVSHRTRPAVEGHRSAWSHRILPDGDDLTVAEPDRWGRHHPACRRAGRVVEMPRGPGHEVVGVEADLGSEGLDDEEPPAVTRPIGDGDVAGDTVEIDRFTFSGIGIPEEGAQMPPPSVWARMRWWSPSTGENMGY